MICLLISWNRGNFLECCLINTITYGKSFWMRKLFFRAVASRRALLNLRCVFRRLGWLCGGRFWRGLNLCFCRFLGGRSHRPWAGTRYRKIQHHCSKNCSEPHFPLQRCCCSSKFLRKVVEGLNEMFLGLFDT